MLREGVWCNLHVLPGAQRASLDFPQSGAILEIRVTGGYGIRWAGDWTTDGRPSALSFRGFLEPQMLDGHEKGWRH